MYTDTEHAEKAMTGIFPRNAIKMDDEPETPATPEKAEEKQPAPRMANWNTSCSSSGKC